MQGTTGKELLKLDDDILAQIGIKNPLHRMQLINLRNDLLTQQEQDAVPFKYRQQGRQSIRLKGCVTITVLGDPFSKGKFA